MNLLDLFGKYQGKILDKTLLISYDLFFDYVVREYCRFVIDDYTQLKKLNNIILKIKHIDKSAEIYVDTYMVDFLDKKLFIYSDTIWINTKIELNNICNFFKNLKTLEPSYINLLSNEKVDLVISSNNKIQGYNLFLKNKNLDKIKILYWN